MKSGQQTDQTCLMRMLRGAGATAKFFSLLTAHWGGGQICQAQLEGLRLTYPCHFAVAPWPLTGLGRRWYRWCGVVARRECP